MRSLSARTTVTAIALLCVAAASTSDARVARTGARAQAITIPFELRENHVYVQVTVNGSAPLWFILDTGAPFSLIGLERARALGLPLELAGKARGVGASTLDAYVVREPVSLRLGNATWSEPMVAVSLEMPTECSDDADRGMRSDQRTRAASNSPMEGVLGRTFFEAYVVAIDYGSRQIRLYEPDEYRFTERGAVLPFELSDGIPVVSARVTSENRRSATVRLAIDVGASSGLTLDKQFADSLRITPPTNRLRTTMVCGLGGAASDSSFEGQLRLLQVGGLVVSNPLTLFGVRLSGRGFDGLLGGAILRDFRAIFDYSRHRLILEP